MTDKNLIIIFVKSPVPGKVKTRLAKDIGKEKACELYKEFTLQIIHQAKKTGADLRIDFYPEEGENLIKNWLGNDYKFKVQQGKNLGEKMADSLMSAFSSGYEKAVLCGSDIPDLKAEIISKAFEKINNSPVIGPAVDGGYYLIGSCKDSFNSEYFTDIAWSTDSVLKTTLEKMEKLGLKPFLLEPLNDIDTIEDLNKWKKL